MLPQQLWRFAALSQPCSKPVMHLGGMLYKTRKATLLLPIMARHLVAPEAGAQGALASCCCRAEAASGAQVPLCPLSCGLMLQPAAFLAKHLAGSVDSLLTPSYAAQARSRAESPLAQHDADACVCRPGQVRLKVCRRAASSDCEAAGLALALVPRRRSVLCTESLQVPYSADSAVCPGGSAAGPAASWPHGGHHRGPSLGGADGGSAPHAAGCPVCSTQVQSPAISWFVSVLMDRGLGASCQSEALPLYALRPLEWLALQYCPVWPYGCAVLEYLADDEHSC